MAEDFDQQLKPEERASLDALMREKPPPAFLEEQVVRALKDARLIRPRHPARRGKRGRFAFAFAAAALFLLGMLGGWVGGRWTSTTAPESNLPQFLLVLRSSARELQADTPEEAVRKYREYEAWAGEIHKAGLMLGGEELKAESRLLRAIGGRVAISESLPGQSEGVVAGYFLIRAEDYNHAATIAERCPHLKYGGSVEVRQINRL